MSQYFRIKDLNDKLTEGKKEEFIVSGFVGKVRRLSKVTFLLLTDHTYPEQPTKTLQCVFKKRGINMTNGSYVELKGLLIKRNPKQVNNQPLGNLEFLVSKVIYLSACHNQLDSETICSSADQVKFHHQYIHLRSSKMRDMLQKNHKLTHLTHSFFVDNGFLHVTTPKLGKSTPEGARDFLVPSSLQKKMFYGLPQSPQLFKQVLIYSGIDRYYQLATCFRDEGMRSNRQPEFNQIDLELVCKNIAEIQDVIERYTSFIYQAFTGQRQQSIPILTYQESMSLYGSDKPDLRIKGLQLQHLDKPGYSQLPFELNDDQYRSYCQIFPGLSYQDQCFTGETKQLGLLRTLLAADFDLYQSTWSPVFIVDFPMFQRNENGVLDVLHHPFTFCEDFDTSNIDIANLKSAQVDLVVNGEELGGGSLRQTNATILHKVLHTLGYAEKVIQDRFGFLMQGLNSGTPIHGGFALGFERLLMLLTNTHDIKHVIPFPKSQTGSCYLTQAPSSIDPEHLKELELE